MIYGDLDDDEYDDEYDGPHVYVGPVEREVMQELEEAEFLALVTRPLYDDYYDEAA